MTNSPAIANDRKLKILLLEDEPSLRAMFAGIIRHWHEDAELVTFDDGDDAWQELTRTQPDLLITDASHPGLQGGVIVNRLAQRRATCGVLWTSGGSDDELAKAVNRLHLEVLPKPFGLEAFEEKLNQLTRPDPAPSLRAAPRV